MTIEQKKEALREALSKAWNCSTFNFEWIKWEESKDSSQTLVLSGKVSDNERYTFHHAGCKDVWGGQIYIDYNPEEDLVGIYIKERPIQAKFKDDILSIFMKHSPFGMSLSFDEEMTPLLAKKSKVEPKDFLEYLGEFRKAYDEYYPLFYMISVCAVKWYDGFFIGTTHCVDGVYY